MPTLVQRVRALSKSTTEVNSNSNIVEYLKDGARYVINGLPSHMLNIVATSSTITSSTGMSINTLLSQSKIISIKRGSVECTQVPESESYAYNSDVTVTSLNAASKFFPVYYIQNANIFIKPNPTTGYHGVVTYPLVPALTTASTGWKTAVDNIVVKYAASADTKALSGYYMSIASSDVSNNVASIATALSAFESALPTWSSVTLTALSYTNIADALTKAQNLIDNLGNTDLESYLTDEDSEMAAVAVNGAAQEVNRAMREIDEESLKIKSYDAETQYEVNRFAAALQLANSYLTEASRLIEASKNSDTFFNLANNYSNMSNTLYNEAQAELDRLISTDFRMMAIGMKSRQQETS